MSNACCIQSFRCCGYKSTIFTVVPLHWVMHNAQLHILWHLDIEHENIVSMCTVTLCLVTLCTVPLSTVTSLIVHCDIVHCVIVHCSIVYCDIFECSLWHCALCHYVLLHCALWLCALFHCALWHCSLLHCSLWHCALWHRSLWHCALLHCALVHCALLHCALWHCARSTLNLWHRAIQRCALLQSAHATLVQRTILTLRIVPWTVHPVLWYSALPLTVHLSERKCTIAEHKLHQLLSTLMSLWSPEELCSQNCFFYFGHCWVWSAKCNARVKTCPKTKNRNSCIVPGECHVMVMVVVGMIMMISLIEYFSCDFCGCDEDDFFECDTYINSLSWIPERSFGSSPTGERWIDLM